jgi:hypothetical protein
MTVDELVSCLSDKSRDKIDGALAMLPAGKAKQVRNRLDELQLVGVA